MLAYAASLEELSTDFRSWRKTICFACMSPLRLVVGIQIGSVNGIFEIQSMTYAVQKFGVN